MSRSIDISTSVYSAIWGARKDGEETENDILERLFNVGSSEVQRLIPSVEKGIGIDGYYDQRNQVHFPENFRTFRTYKGNLYFAVAQNGMWLRADNNQHYSSLNKLNESIVNNSENIWNGNWQYLDDNGLPVSINLMRN